MQNEHRQVFTIPRKLKWLSLALIAPLAFADGGFYTGIGAGYADVSNTTQNPQIFNNGTLGTQSGSTFASNLYFGYDFNRFIGVQAEYDVAFGATIANSYNAGQQLLGASLLVHLPFSLFSDMLSGVSVFAKGGYVYNTTTFGNVNQTCPNCVNPPTFANGFTPIYGLGAEYGFTNVGFRLEWDTTPAMVASNSNLSQVSVASNMFLLSILYHF